MVPSTVIKAGTAAVGTAMTYNWLAGVVISKKRSKMREIWNIVLELLGLVKSKKLDPITNGKTQVWYGRVNRWSKKRSTWQKEMDALVKYGGSGYMIELATWNSEVEGAWWSDTWVKNQIKIYKQILSDARARGLWLFVSVVNDNMGSGKYGDTKQYTVGSCYNQIVKLLNGVIEAGKDNVIVQPVAETQTSGGKKFEDYAKKLLASKGFLTCNNGSGGHPTSTNGMNFYAVHPSKISASNPANSFVISDHGLIIRELNQGGQLVAHGDPGKIATWVRNNRAKGCPVVGYYAFKVDDYDGEAIKALCSAAKSPVCANVFEKMDKDPQ